MRFDPPLRRGRFLRRYRRFFADLELEGLGEVVTHCPNTGSLRGCLVEGAPILAHRSDNPKRRLEWTWAAIEVDGAWVGVWSAKAETLVLEALAGGVLLPELAGYPDLQTQVAYGGADGRRSRVDILLSRAAARAPKISKNEKLGKAEKKPPGSQEIERIYVEVKSTTMRLAPGVAAFPDAVTTRGRKHLGELTAQVAAGARAALVLVVQRDDCGTFAPADAIDPAWGAALRQAIAAGVEVYALGAAITPAAITPGPRLELALALGGSSLGEPAL